MFPLLCGPPPGRVTDRQGLVRDRVVNTLKRGSWSHSRAIALPSSKPETLPHFEGVESDKPLQFL